MKRRAGAGAAVLISLATGCVLASCNFVVGVGDYTVGDAEVDGPAGGSSGTGSGSSTGGGSSGGGTGSSSGGSGGKLEGGSSGSGSSGSGSSGSGSGSSGSSGSSSGSGDSGGGDVRDSNAGSDASEVGLGDADAAASGEGDAGGGDADGRDAEAEAATICGQGLPAPQPDAGSDFQRLVSTCVLAVSCDPYFFDVNISKCISQDYLQSALSLGCLSQITSCGDYYTCQGSRLATSAECSVSGSASCAGGTTAIDCTANPGIVTNCAQFGETCSMYSTAGGIAVGCVAPVTCVGTSSANACASNYLYTCANGVAYGQNCATIQSTCQTVGASTDCYYNASPCNSPNTYSCSGGALSLCSAAMQSLNLDCRRAALTCSMGDAGTGYCVAPGCATPPPSSCTEACADAHTLSVCVGGAPYAIDCSLYGFTGCTTQMESSSNTVFAYCY